jgi:hypothetical protein
MTISIFVDKTGGISLVILEKKKKEHENYKVFGIVLWIVLYYAPCVA